MNKKHLNFLAICLFLVSMLSACISRKNKQSPFSFPKSTISESISHAINADPLPEKKSVESIVTIQQVKQIEAKHADLPIPINAVPVPAHCVCDSENGEQLKLAYRCTNTPEVIAAFYHQTMEGWQEIGRFEGEEYLIHYQRPDKWCSVAIRNTTSKHDPNLVVYMAPSKQIIS